MPWDWNSRATLPVAYPGINSLHGTSVPTGGGTKGGSQETSKTQAWGQYEAEYLKNALAQPERKYDTDGLGETEKQIYLDRSILQMRNRKFSQVECNPRRDVDNSTGN